MGGLPDPTLDWPSSAPDVGERLTRAGLELDARQRARAHATIDRVRAVLAGAGVACDLELEELGAAVGVGRG